MTSVLGAFESTKKQFRGEIVRNSGRIRETQTLKKPLRIAFERKVVQLLETFDLEVVKSCLKSKAGYDKTLSHVLLGEMLEIIRDQHLASINDFDSVMILFDNMPVYCFLNSSKLKTEQMKKKLSLTSERFAKRLKSEVQEPTNLDKLFFVEDVVSSVSEMLSGEKEEDFQMYCALQMDEYSYCLDLNHHVHTNLTLISSRNLILCGIATLVVGIGTYLYYRNPVPPPITKQN
jgi:5'(3')-deoxyribonucleotidase